MALIHGHGNNDLPNGWYKQSDENYKIYMAFYEMLRKVYPRYKSNALPTYKEVSICDEWLTLSNFARDIKELDGYSEWISGNKKYHFRLKKVYGTKPIYSKENCEFGVGAIKRVWMDKEEE